MGGGLRGAVLAAGCAVIFGVLPGGGCDFGSNGPTTIDIGDNDPDTIVAFGDSISYGTDSSDGTGYRDDLELLFANDERPGIRVLNEGEPGSFSEDGVDRIDAVLRTDRPAVLILLYGTNDEAEGLPQSLFSQAASTTSDNLRQIIAAGRANNTIVVLSTLPPVCGHAREAQRANIIAMNEKIRALGAELADEDAGVILADPWTKFLEKAPSDGCALIGDSGNHPTDLGYSFLAETYFNALENVAW